MIARAPMRISFGGGNTDLEPFRSECGGVTFGAAVNKYAYVSSSYGNNLSPLVLAIKDRMSYDGNMGIKSDAKPMSGLGASGAIAVATIAYIGAGKLSKKMMASLAYDVERKDLKIMGGFQDQVFASFGGMIYVEFNSDGDYEVIPMPRSAFIDDLENRIIIVHVGDRSTSGPGVLEDVVRRNEKEILLDIKEIATEQRYCVSHEDLNGFAELVNQSWMLKKELSPFISTQKIDALCNDVMKNGAIAFKLCGAGGGGYAMILCDNVAMVVDKLMELGFDAENVGFDWGGVVVDSRNGV